MSSIRNTFRWTGWILVAVGLFLLLRHYFGFEIWWGIALLGGAFLLMGLSRRESAGMVAPGVLLLTIGTSLLLRQHNLVWFELWRLWPLLFGALGLAVIADWAVGCSRGWVLLPGGILLFVAGAGWRLPSFIRYQVWLRGFLTNWPMLLMLAGAALLVGHLGRQSASKTVGRT